jgi:hypothetical protein
LVQQIISIAIFFLEVYLSLNILLNNDSYLMMGAAVVIYGVVNIMGVVGLPLGEGIGM